MLRVTLRSFWEHKRRLISTVVAIVLGVAFMAGTFVLTDTLSKVFDDLFAEVNDEIDVQVQGEVIFSGFMGDERRDIDASLLDDIRELEGISAAEGWVAAFGASSSNRVLGADGEPVGGQGPPTILENWISDPALSSYEIADGRAPEADDEVALNVGAADDAEVEVGDDLTVVTQAGRKTYRLVGTFTSGSAESIAGAVSADFTLAEAQRIAGTEGFQNIFVAGDGASERAVAELVTTVVPEGFEVLTGEEATEQLSSDVQSGFAFFEQALTLFGGIALLVGVFVISNTFSILVAQRTRELALLRAVGASRRQVLTSVMTEAILIGFISAIIGLLVGIGLAKLVTSALESAGADLPTTSLAILPATVISAFVIGVGITLIAAIVPAVRATRVPPLAALRDVAIDRSGASKPRIVLGIIVLLLGAFNLSAAWTQDGDTDAVPTVGTGSLLLVVGAIVIGPVLAAPSIRVLGGLLPRLRGVTGKLATENAARSPKRTSATASALLIGVALVSFITVFAASATESVTAEVERGFAGDFVIQSESLGFGFGGFPPSVADTVAAVDGVDVVTSIGYTGASVTYSDGDTADTQLWAIDPTTITEVLAPRMAEGDITALDADGILVDQQVAEDAGVQIGDVLSVTVPGGARFDLTVQGLSDDQTLLGSFAFTRQRFLESVPEVLDIQVVASVDDDADVDEVIAAVEEATTDTPALDVLDREAFIGTLADQITSFVTVIYALLLLSIVIALIGIGNTLSLSINERTRELGLLRAVGMDRKQLKSAIRWEAVLISVLGAVVGIALGLLLSYALVESLSGFGLNTFSLPVGSLVVIVVLAALLGTLASVRPGRRAARLGILDAIATD